MGRKPKWRRNLWGDISESPAADRQLFHTAGQRRNPALPAAATTLFTIWSGANDVFADVESGGSDGVTPEGRGQQHISASINALYADGGRYFLRPQSPSNQGDSPSYRDDIIKQAMANAFVDSYNALLDSSLDSLSGSLNGVTIIKLDINQLFVNIVANPALYGFTNVTDPAYIRFGTEPYQPADPPYGTTVANPDSYFYWDATHGTALTNSIIGEAAYEAAVPGSRPPGGLFLGAGLTLLVPQEKSRRQKSPKIPPPNSADKHRGNALTFFSSTATPTYLPTSTYERKNIFTDDLFEKYQHWNGIATFLRCPHEPNFKDTDIGVIGYPYGGGNPVEHMQYLGPRTIRNRSMGYSRLHREFRIDPFKMARIRDLGDVPSVAPSGA